MADVTEVIHKITYEVNNEALGNASKAIQFQISELERLGKSLGDYTKQLNKVTSRSSADIDALSGKIGEVNAKIAASVAKTEGVFQQAGKGVLKGLDVSEDVKGLVAKVFAPIKTEQTGCRRILCTYAGQAAADSSRRRMEYAGILRQLLQ